MRQETIVAKRPEVCVDRIAALFGRKLNDDAPAALKALLQKPGQDLLQGLALQVVEKDLGHRSLSGQGLRAAWRMWTMIGTPATTSQ